MALRSFWYSTVDMLMLESGFPHFFPENFPLLFHDFPGCMGSTSTQPHHATCDLWLLCWCFSVIMMQWLQWGRIMRRAMSERGERHVTCSTSPTGRACHNITQHNIIYSRSVDIHHLINVMYSFLYTTDWQPNCPIPPSPRALLLSTAFCFQSLSEWRVIMQHFPLFCPNVPCFCAYTCMKTKHHHKQ